LPIFDLPIAGCRLLTSLYKPQTSKTEVCATRLKAGTIAGLKSLSEISNAERRINNL